MRLESCEKRSNVDNRMDRAHVFLVHGDRNGEKDKETRTFESSTPRGDTCSIKIKLHFSAFRVLLFRVCPVLEKELSIQ